jgi:hypothetical protein
MSFFWNGLVEVFVTSGDLVKWPWNFTKKTRETSNPMTSMSVLLCRFNSLHTIFNGFIVLWAIKQKPMIATQFFILCDEWWAIKYIQCKEVSNKLEKLMVLLFQFKIIKIMKKKCE